MLSNELDTDDNVTRRSP